jgi:two-component system, NarL family, sensor histidine kinase DesK
MSAVRDRGEGGPPGTLGSGGSFALVAFLFMLGFPLAHMLRQPPGTAHVALVCAGLAVFVALYLAVMLVPHDRRTTLALIAGMCVVGAAVALDDTAEWATLFIYVSAACGFRLRPAEAARGIAAATVATGALSFGLAGYPTDDAVTYVIYAVGIGALLLGYGRLVSTNAELVAARDEIARLAVGEERLRFARDLHDLLGHSLSLIALKSELARRLIGADPERAAGEVREIEQVSRDALVEVRDAVSGYRRMTLEAELRGAQVALEAAGIRPEVGLPPASFAPEVEAVLAWAVREGTTNVIRHSGARHCAIHVHAGLTDAGVEIVDDGTAGDAGAPPGSGLAGLEERAHRLRGRVEAGRRAEGGFRLAVELPALP